MNALPPASIAEANLLSSFLPRLQVTTIANSPDPLLQPTEERCLAASLFIDVSGFSALAEQLSRSGPIGAEQLAEIINSLFGPITEFVTRQGGDILAFAGDAVLAIWPVHTEEALSGVALQALQAAFAVQNRFSNYRPRPDVHLRLRATIGAGPLSAMQVGGDQGSWLFLVTGDAIQQVAVADKLAQLGKVVLSPMASRHLQHACNTSALEGGHAVVHELLAPLPRIEEVSSLSRSLQPERIRSFVPRFVAERVSAGHEDWLAEFRDLTVCFISLPPELFRGNLELLHRAVRTAQQAIFRYGGTTYQLLMDDKGLTLIAAFGMPLSSHENDASRAIDASLCIQRELVAQGLSPSIGVTTGKLFCGVYGTHQRRQYTLIGPVINLSARLMQAAKGRLLCDEMTHDAVCRVSRLSFEALKPLAVKGWPTPVPIYQPMPDVPVSNSVPRFHEDSRIFGRVIERETMTEMVRLLVQHNQRGLLLVEGEAGIGKSRLLGFVQEQVRATGGRCLVGAGDPIEHSSPYHAWRNVFWQLFSLDAVSNEQQARLAHIERQLLSMSGVSPRLLPLLNAVLPLEAPENEVTSALSGDVRAQQTHSFLLACLSASPEPTAIVLEDGHWFDSASWQLLAIAARHSRPLLLVISIRPIVDETEPLRQLLSSTPHQRLLLQGLSREETLELVRQNLGGHLLAEAMASLLYERSAGNPFFSIEFALALRSLHWLDGAEAIPHLVPDQAGGKPKQPIPRTIQGIVSSRIDHLASETQLTLKVASVLGQQFTVAVLEEIHPLSVERSSLATQLKELEQADLIQAYPAIQEPTYRFKHAVTQEVAYESLAFVHRRRLHRVVAERYERVFASIPSYLYALLAHHWREANVADKTVVYLACAGQHALRSFAHPEAIGFLQEALEIDQQKQDSEGVTERDREERASTRALWELQLGEAYANWSKYPESRRHLEQGLKLYGHSVPESTVAVLVGLLGESARQLAHRLLPEHFLGRSANQERLLQAARAYQFLIETYYITGLDLHCVHAALRGLNVAEKARPSPELTCAYASIGSILGFIPAPALADAYVHRAEGLLQQQTDRKSEAYVALAVGVYEAGQGRFDSALVRFQRSMETAEQIGYHRQRDDCLENLAALAYCQGRFGEGVQLAERNHQSAQERGDPRCQAEALRNQGYCLLALGRTSELQSCVQQLQLLTRHVATQGRGMSSAGWLVLQALLHMGHREPEATLQCLREVERYEEALKIPFWSLMFEHAGLATVWLWLWEMQVEGAQKESKKACNRLASHARTFPIAQPAALRCRGLLRWLEGKQSEAQRDWNQSLALARKLAVPYDEALVRWEMGRHLMEQVPTKFEHLREAQALLQRLGAAPALGEALPPADSHDVGQHRVAG